MTCHRMPYCANCGALLKDEDRFCPKCGTPVKGASAPQAGQPSVTAGMPDSGIKILTENSKAQNYWLRRLIALVIDSIIIGVVVGIIAVILTIPLLITGGFTSIFNAVVFPVIVGLFSLLYFPASEVYNGATFGKSIMGLKVTTLSGAKPSWGQAFIRNISKIYWLLLLLDVIVGLAVQTDYRQKFSDKYAGTIVVDK